MLSFYHGMKADWTDCVVEEQIRSKSLFLSLGCRPYSLLWMLIHASELAV